VDATIVLTAAEVDVLQELLEGARCRLLLEIAHTGLRSMRQELQERESLVQSVLQKLTREQQRTAEAQPYPELLPGVLVTD
jgi:hypothetical protein